MYGGMCVFVACWLGSRPLTFSSPFAGVLIRVAGRSGFLHLCFPGRARPKFPRFDHRIPGTYWRGTLHTRLHPNLKSNKFIQFWLIAWQKT